MEEFTYGPVEILLITFDGDRPGPALRDALLDLVEEKTVTLLDLIFVSRAEDGDLRIIEVEDLPEKAQLPDLDLRELGLAGVDDVEELAAQLPPGASAAVLVVELTWARRFASVLAASGGEVLYQERIPAPVVNAVLEAATTAPANPQPANPQPANSQPANPQPANPQPAGSPSADTE